MKQIFCLTLSTLVDIGTYHHTMNGQHTHKDGQESPLIIGDDGKYPSEEESSPGATDQ